MIDLLAWILNNWHVGFWVLGFTLLIDDDVKFYFR